MQSNTPRNRTSVGSPPVIGRARVNNPAAKRSLPQRRHVLCRRDSTPGRNRPHFPDSPRRDPGTNDRWPGEVESNGQSPRRLPNAGQQLSPAAGSIESKAANLVRLSAASTGWTIAPRQSLVTDHSERPLTRPTANRPLRPSVPLRPTLLPG